jgi:hypothetical protein
VASTTLICPNQGIHGLVGAEAPGGQEIQRDHKKEYFVEHTCIMQEAHDRLQVQHKLETLHAKLAEAWPKIQKVTLELPKASDVSDPEK